MKEYAQFAWHSAVLLAQTAGWLAASRVKPAAMSGWLQKKMERRIDRIRELWCGTGARLDED